jgi:hypothetical protein
MDALALASALRRFRRSSTADVLIFDRYIYDQIANFRIEKRWARRFVHSVLRLIPEPDLAFVLDAEPEHARARKPEYPLQFIRENRARYIKLSAMAGLDLVPPGTVEQAEDSIRNRILPLLMQPRALSSAPALTSRSG